MNVKDAKARQMAPLGTPTNLTSNGTQDISGALTTLLADMFALSLKTKNFHWHMSGQSNSIESGPRIGVQKVPLAGRNDSARPRRSWSGLRSRGARGGVRRSRCHRRERHCVAA